MDIPHEPCDECGRRENTVILCPDCFTREVHDHLETAALRDQIAKQQAEMAKLRKLFTPRAGGGGANPSRGTSPAAGLLEENLI